ncbi:hypothetical protein J6590_096842 [Homalodisca vitripennis]|nr:hypothetical protein J6590_096842 [Homalodisca vitripennis]
MFHFHVRVEIYLFIYGKISGLAVKQMRSTFNSDDERPTTSQLTQHCLLHLCHFYLDVSLSCSSSRDNSFILGNIRSTVPAVSRRAVRVPYRDLGHLRLKSGSVDKHKAVTAKYVQRDQPISMSPTLPYRDLGHLR